MPKGYAIVRVTIDDEDRYADYRAGTQASLEPHGGRFIVRGGATECVEGTWDAGRTVVIEFPSIEDARAWYHGDAYQQLARIRREASTADFVLVEGVD
jgi:uncharacterized protein (DUF1330 family)